MERLKYEHYDSFRELVKHELKNKNTVEDFNSWIDRLSNGLNGDYHPNDLMKLFILATDRTIIIPKKYKGEIQKKSMNALKNWVVQHPIRDRAFTRVCMEYLVKTKEISSDLVFNILEILDIMGVDFRGEHKIDEEWLHFVRFRFYSSNWVTTDGRTVDEVIKGIIQEGKTVYIRDVTNFLTTLVEITESNNIDPDGSDSTVGSLFEDISKDNHIKVRECFCVNRRESKVGSLPKKIDCTGVKTNGI